MFAGDRRTTGVLGTGSAVALILGFICLRSAYGDSPSEHENVRVLQKAGDQYIAVIHGDRIYYCQDWKSDQGRGIYVHDLTTDRDEKIYDGNIVEPVAAEGGRVFWVSMELNDDGTSRIDPYVMSDDCIKRLTSQENLGRSVVYHAGSLAWCLQTMNQDTLQVFVDGRKIRELPLDSPLGLVSSRMVRWAGENLVVGTKDGLFLLERDGAGLRWLSTTRPVLDFAVFEDKVFYFAGRRNGPSLYVYNIQTGKQEVLIERASSPTCKYLCVEDDHVAFLSLVDGRPIAPGLVYDVKLYSIGSGTLRTIGRAAKFPVNLSMSNGRLVWTDVNENTGDYDIFVYSVHGMTDEDDDSDEDRSMVKQVYLHIDEFVSSPDGIGFYGRTNNPEWVGVNNVGLVLGAGTATVGQLDEDSGCQGENLILDADNSLGMGKGEAWFYPTDCIGERCGTSDHHGLRLDASCEGVEVWIEAQSALHSETGAYVKSNVGNHCYAWLHDNESWCYQETVTLAHDCVSFPERVQITFGYRDVTSIVSWFYELKGIKYTFIGWYVTVSGLEAGQPCSGKIILP